MKKKIRFLAIILLMMLVCACQNKETVMDEKDSNVEDKFVRTEDIGNDDKIEMTAEEEVLQSEINSSEEKVSSAAEINKKALAAYEEFLNEKRSAYIPQELLNSYTGLEKNQNKALLSEILQMVIELNLDYKNLDGKIKEIQYAYLDCGNDGIQELIIRFVGLDFYEPNDDSDCIYIIRYENDELTACYTTESWARSNTTVYYHGLLVYNGSGGAGCQYYGESVIDAGGDEKILFEVEELSGMDCSYVESDLYYQVFTGDTYHVMGIDVYDINGEKYRTYEMDPVYERSCLEYISLCEQAGISFCSEKEIQQAIATQKEKLGIIPEMMEKKELEWQALESNMYSDYIQE